ncbi:hypothetical protein JCM31826_01350 [Thermaurantimonas aggregans]|uniref:Phage late control gene D protein (GPD) n=2 Tax=Thermaurantimonas aggregans TaxID=2173829 RepID=A0A401XI16_9FLAO|nr:hypothetical protein JCM31826_01350 [Thermaurantimonas aggregans]
MLLMQHKILIAGKQLKNLERLTIINSVDAPLSAAEIVIPYKTIRRPFTVLHQSNSDLSLIKKGAGVEIHLGYNNKLKLEFEGYITHVDKDNTSITVQCEDKFFEYKKNIADKIFTNTSIETIINYIHQQLKLRRPYSIDIDIKYSKFSIIQQTAYDVLKRLAEETHLQIFIKNDHLYITPKMLKKFNLIKYHTEKNIEKIEFEKTNLSEHKVEIIIETKNKQGQTIQYTYGERGGDKIYLKIQGIENQKDLKKIAEQAYNNTKINYQKKCKIIGWLQPYTSPGDVVELKGTEINDGLYYCQKVEVHYGETGGMRNLYCVEI